MTSDPEIVRARQVQAEVNKLLAKYRHELARGTKLAQFPRWSPEHDLAVRVLNRANVYRSQAKLTLNSY